MGGGEEVCRVFQEEAHGEAKGGKASVVHLASWAALVNCHCSWTMAYKLDHDLLCFLDDDVRIFSTLVSVQWVPPPPFLSFSSDPVM